MSHLSIRWVDGAPYVRLEEMAAVVVEAQNEVARQIYKVKDEDEKRVQQIEKRQRELQAIHAQSQAVDSVFHNHKAIGGVVSSDVPIGLSGNQIAVQDQQPARRLYPDD